MIAAFAAAVIVVGSSVVAVMPRAVAGGLLMAAGLGLLVDWLRQLARGMNRLDALLSTAVLAVIVGFGVLPGIVAGLLAAAMLFVFQYGRISPVASARDLQNAMSNVDRSRAGREALIAHAAEVRVLELTGYLFFGSLRKIADEIRVSIDDAELRYLILDFRRVRGVDSSVISGFEALERRAQRAGVVILWSQVPPSLREQFGATPNTPRHYADDLDRALEVVEGTLLDDGLAATLIDEPWLSDIAPFGKELQLQEGEVLIDRSDSTRRMFVVVTGTLTAWGETDAGSRIRYRQVGPGSLLGEIAFTTGSPRTAIVIADSETTVIALAPGDLEDMASNAPELASRTHRIIAERLAERLEHTTRTVRELNR